MPHSSGGGSHSGGSHHSSSHSRSSGGSHHSSSHSYSRSSGGSGSVPRYSKRPFYGSRRYRYYGIGGRPHYIYAVGNPHMARGGCSAVISLFIESVIFLVFIAAGIAALTSAINFPSKLSADYYDSGVYIDDTLNVMSPSEEKRLTTVLVEFKETTGICPYIVTVSDSDWEDDYYLLADYAYDVYVERFNDEKHFLIVYSEPEASGKVNYVDWKWEAVQGDYTDSVLTESKFAKIQEDLQTYLNSEDYSVAKAFKTAFSDSLDYIMDAEVFEDEDAVIFFIFIGIFIIVPLILLVSTVRGFIMRRRAYEEVPFY